VQQQWNIFAVAVSLSNYRKIPKGSILDEDSDSFDDDEWDRLNKGWDSFEVYYMCVCCMMIFFLLKNCFLLK